jgi:serine/threonine protein kinase
MRLLSIGIPWNITLPAPKKHWLVDTYNVLLRWIHLGVHPNFNLAASSLYHRCVRRNLQYRNSSFQMLSHSPIKARLYFLCFVRTRPLIKFTEYHSQELNALDSELLSEIYAAISQIKQIKRSMLRSNRNSTLRKEFQEFNQASAFKLLSLLAQVTFQRV